MSRTEWAASAGIVVVLGGLGGLLPIVDRSLAGNEPLPAGTVLHVGQISEGVRKIAFTVPDGWVLARDHSDLSTGLSLSKGGTTCYVSVVVLTADRYDHYPTAQELWSGVRRTVPLQWNAEAGTGTAVTVTRQGVAGVTGGLSGGGRVGTASVFAVRDTGAESIAMGPPGSYADVSADVRSIARSIVFTGGTE